MTEKRDHEKLPKAIQPFSRALAVHDALPSGFKPSDETPLRECISGLWPTVADLRALVEWGSANPSPQSNLTGDIDDKTVIALARKHFDEKVYDRLTFEKSPPMFPQATYDAPTYALSQFVKAVRSTTTEGSSND